MRRLAALIACTMVAGCAHEPDLADPGRIWELVSVDDRPFPATATLTFGPEGELTGEAPCNRLTGTWSLNRHQLTLGPIATTRRACPALEAEVAFLAILDGVDHVDIDTSDSLILSGSGHRMLFREAPTP